MIAITSSYADLMETGVFSLSDSAQYALSSGKRVDWTAMESSCTKNVCQRELPLLEQFYLESKPARLRVLSVGFADTRTNVEAFVKARLSVFVFPTAYDEDRWVANAFKINATPTYMLVYARGNIVLVHRGGGLLQSGRFREFLSALNG